VTKTLLIEWFLLALLAMLVARLLGGRRGHLAAVACSWLWLLFALTAGWEPTQPTAWTILAIVAAGAFITFIGLWSAEATISMEDAARPRPASAAGGSSSASVSGPANRPANAESRWIPALIREFEDWLQRYGTDVDPWPDFGEFVRSVIHQFCGGSAVRPYRILSEGDMLLPLRPLENADEAATSARTGVLGYVATSGKSYLAGDPIAGELVQQLAARDMESTAWAFPIRQGARRVGLVSVGQLANGTEITAALREKLVTVELITGLFWNMLAQTCRVRCLAHADPVTGLLGRDAFLAAAEEALQDCYRRDEPVALVAITVEGLRALDDQGHWARINSLIAEIGELISHKCRSHDCLGRFDDSRFLLLLRRVDSELALLIVDQLMTALQPFGQRGTEQPPSVTFRCGVVGSGLGKPSLAALISRATAQCHEARRLMVPLCSDVGVHGRARQVAS
jgi:diguanylate cyclase (GGDEF)-like protein